MTLPIDPVAFASEAEEEINRQTNFRGIRRQVASLPETLRSDRARALFQWWRDAGAPAPRSAFDIAAHARSAAHLYLIRRCEPGVFEYRLAGDEGALPLSAGMAGVTCSTAGSRAISGTSPGILEQVAAGRRPWYCVGEIEMAERPALIPFESPGLSADREDGSIAWILGVIEALDRSCAIARAVPSFPAPCRLDSPRIGTDFQVMLS